MSIALIDPFALSLDLASGELAPVTGRLERRISHMRGMYADVAVERALIAGGDPLVYEVLVRDVPPENGQLAVCTTILQPGRVGDEYYMTKGHYHARRETGEVYLGLQGYGLLLLQAEGQFKTQEMLPGTVLYIPPYWAHRTVNVGDTPLAFLSVYPADAGHDYGTIERDGFPQRVVSRAGAPTLVPVQ
jgi:glucose-6-phosphate isomerase, archaeal